MANKQKPDLHAAMGVSTEDHPKITIPDDKARCDILEQVRELAPSCARSLVVLSFVTCDDLPIEACRNCHKMAIFQLRELADAWEALIKDL